jgi:uncharacterized protein YxjI
MIYKMRQKLFALGHDFTIQDETGQDVYEVDGKFISLGNKLAFRDMAGNELAYITQKLLSWGPTYEISRNGQLQAVVKEALFTLFRHRFTVDVEGPNDLTAQGNFLDYEYTFTRNDQTVATISKKWFTILDTYGVEVAEGEDTVLILASAVVIDLVREAAHHRR